MIFGIFGKFGIEIGTRKKIGRKKFRRKKFENFWSENFLGQKNVFFEKKIGEKVNENPKFQNFEKKSKHFRNFENLNFHSLFHRKKIQQKIEKC